MSAIQTAPPIAVVGGVYGEQCMHPPWQEVYGSAGRAASALARMEASVELHAFLDASTQVLVESRGALERFDLRPTPIDRSLSFDYHHGLDTPRILGLGPRHPPLQVSAEHIVRFGMLEGDAVVHGERVVYDPQDSTAPQHFHANGSTARQLALVLNRHEATLLAGLSNLPTEALAAALLRQAAADVVIVKQGPLGALVHDGASVHTVPAYRSASVWKIGSGDNFVAHFAHRWLLEGRSAAESADLASKATAFYCETRGFASPRSLADYAPSPIVPSTRFTTGYRPSVYLAGPFFTLAQLWIVEQARTALRDMGLEVFSPYHDVGHGSANDVVAHDLAGIDRTDLVFAITDGLDAGTVYEIGYAHAKGKPVVVYSENETADDKKMMEGSGCHLCDDFVSAVYETLWIACTL